MDASLFDRLNQLILLNPAQKADLWQVIKPISAPKGTVLLEKGEVCDQIYFAISGIIRASCWVEDKDVTRWFCFPNHFATDYFSFVYRQPSEDTLVASTDVSLLSISYQALQDLCRKDAIWIDLNRRLLEEYYLSLQSRVVSFQTQSTAERYRSALTQFPNIEEQVALGHLASYLGMSQETLSRLRHQRRQRLAR